MQVPLLNDRDLDFLLYEVFRAQDLLSRPRYQEHSRETFAMSIATAKKIAERYFLNHYAKGDANEPKFADGNAIVIEETHQAWKAFADAGFLAAPYSFEEGGMQLPQTIMGAINAYFYGANPGTSGYCLLCLGVSNLIREFGSDQQKYVYLPHLKSGRFTGTMALTEPSQGSYLQDISTRAELAEDGSYRLFGQKMYISGGDHDLTENIIHMVLAKTVCPNSGKDDISLFLTPKYLMNDDGELGDRNDVALAGLLHKMGFRNTTSTVLNFGENDGAVGYLIGELNHGLRYMFQMMNEARIGVGLFSAALGYQGYNYSLQYAKERKQGRSAARRASGEKVAQVELIQHADVRRMLLAQKAFAEGGLAMTLYASSLYEDIQTGTSAETRESASMVLDLITPVVKSWPAKYCLEANDMAIQVLGGAGYIREHLVEQYYRDNRLNPIHEGTEGIQGIDLLGRKAGSHNGKALATLLALICRDAEAATHSSDTENLGIALLKAAADVESVTSKLLATLAEDREPGLANATVYLHYFGRVFAAWIWTIQALKASQGLSSGETEGPDFDFYKGKLQTAHYYINWELPKMEHEREILLGAYSEALEMKSQWF